MEGTENSEHEYVCVLTHPFSSSCPFLVTSAIVLIFPTSPPHISAGPACIFHCGAFWLSETWLVKCLVDFTEETAGSLQSLALHEYPHLIMSPECSTLIPWGDTDGLQILGLSRLYKYFPLRIQAHRTALEFIMEAAIVIGIQTKLWYLKALVSYIYRMAWRGAKSAFESF